MTYPTFDPAGNGCSLQRGYSWRPIYQVVSDERELGNKTSTVIAERVLHDLEDLRFRANTQEAAEYLESFFNSLRGSAGPFWWTPPGEKIASPHAAPALSSVAGGSQGSRTITVRHAWKTSGGITRASPIGSLLVPANELLVVTLDPYPASVTQAVIYAAEDDEGAEQEQTTLTGLRTWTQPDAALLLATADPPETNSAAYTALWKLKGEIPRVRAVGLSWEATATFEEVYA